MVLASFLIFHHPILADDSTSTPDLNIEISVDVPASCVATDTDNVIHSYAASSSTSYLGICALEAALSSSSVSSVELSNQYPSIGLFVTALDGVSADPASQYWALYQNGDYANVGLTLLPISASDTITFQLHDFSDNNLGDQVTLDINSLIASSSDDISTSTSDAGDDNTQSDNGGGGGTSVAHHNMDVNNAFNFLESNQNSDGSFGSSMYTDWAAIAFGASSENSHKDEITAYEKSALDTSSSATDFERHAMALEALGINPYTGTDTNYIQKIIGEFDGTQIGDPSLINDDIFSIFPLIKAGYSSNDSVIQKVVADIISKQNSNGSWVGGVDMTAAAIQALELVPSLPGVSQAISNAKSYLINQQQSDGGFGSSDATSWALGAISALGDSGINWTDGGNNPYDYLYNLQQNDGGIGATSEDLNTRVWATAYAIPAAENRPWSSILNSFSKPTSVSDATNTTVGTDGIQNTQTVVSTSSPQTIVAVRIATSTVEETGLGERVVRAKRTSEPSSVSVATTTKFSSQAAAVVENENPATITTRSVVFGTASFFSAASLVYLLIIII